MDGKVVGVEKMNALARDLKGVANKKEILKALRKELKEPVPKVRAGIRAEALRILPGRGGLGAWVAKARIAASVKVNTGRSAGITLKAGRNSQGQRSDLDAIDRGRVRAPSWGRRTRASWHTQQVAPGFMSDTVAEKYAADWTRAASDAVDKVVRDLGA